MAKSATARLYNAAVHTLQKRDRTEIRIINAILSHIEPSPRRTRRRRAPQTRQQAVWRGFRSVLCPVDFSEHSRQALRYAEAVARRGRATLTVLYVNDPFLIAAAAAALHDRTLARTSERELRDFIDATLPRPSRERLRVTTSVTTGAPAAEILKAARRGRHDLIVLGTHGLTGADRMLMGSTTATLLKHASVPILAIPRSSPALTPRQRRAWPDGPVVAAIELGAASEKDATLAADIAHWFGSPLLLAHVVPEMATPAWLASTLGFRQRDRARLARAERWLDALAALTRRHVQTTTSAACGNLADEIAGRASASHASLVITVLRSQRGGAGSARGAVSYELLSHAVTPVLACPARWHRR